MSIICTTPTFVTPEALANFREASAHFAELTRPAREASALIAKILEAKPLPKPCLHTATPLPEFYLSRR